MQFTVDPQPDSYPVSRTCVPNPSCLLLLALGCGLVASIGISQIIEQNKQRHRSRDRNTKPILVAMKPITGQEQLKAENIKLEEWPKNLIPKGALTKIEEVEGRRMKFSMVPGDPILKTSSSATKTAERRSTCRRVIAWWPFTPTRLAPWVT